MIRIQRIVTGLIPNDGAVLLDYNLVPQPGHTTNTADFGINCRYEIDKGLLNGLSPYVRYGLQRQTINSGTAITNLLPESYDDVVVGTDYRIWQIVFNAEQQWYDSTISPFNATRCSARYSNRITSKTTASLTGSFALLDYYGVHDYVKDTSVSAAIEADLSKGFTLRGRAVWLDDQDRLFGPTRGVEEQIEAEWKHNQTRIYVRLRNATLSTGAQQNTYQEAQIGITRQF